MERAVIIYGPQGCGKTTHAEKLARHFGKQQVIEADDWRQPTFPDDALVLTNSAKLAYTHSERHGASVYEFSEALLDAGADQREP